LRILYCRKLNFLKERSQFFIETTEKTQNILQVPYIEYTCSPSLLLMYYSLILVFMCICTVWIARTLTKNSQVSLFCPKDEKNSAAVSKICKILENDDCQFTLNYWHLRGKVSQQLHRRPSRKYMKLASSPPTDWFPADVITLITVSGL